MPDLSITISNPIQLWWVTPSEIFIILHNILSLIYCAFHKHANSKVQKPVGWATSKAREKRPGEEVALWSTCPASSEPLLSGIQAQACDQVLQRACLWLDCVLIWLINLARKILEFSQTFTLISFPECRQINTALIETDLGKGMPKAILQGLVLSDFWWMLSKIFLETTII